MELREGEYYSTAQMREFMDVSQSTWSHKRNELLDNFSLYYEYEVEYEGRTTTYHILKKLGDYQGIPNKRDAEARRAAYSTQIIEVIKEDNVQTAANVARIIQNSDAIRVFNHKYGTIQEYSRIQMREMFGSGKNGVGTKGMIMDKIWCRADLENNCYIPMPEEHIKAFYGFFRRERELDDKIEIEIMNDYAVGLLTKEEMEERISQQTFFSYQNARREFRARYGYTPLKVPVYGIEGIHCISFQKKEEETENETN